MIPMMVTLNGGWISLNSLMLVDAPHWITMAGFFVGLF